MKDEVWTTKEGQKINVGDMSEDHVRNALRMILRKRRLVREAVLDDLIEPQDLLHAEAMRALSDPNAYFPLLGCYGSPELAAKHRY